VEQGYTTHGHKTSNISESTNGTLKTAREKDPYYLNDEFLRWNAAKLYERQNVAKYLRKHKKLWTPYAGSIIHQEETLAQEETLDEYPEGDGVFMVEHTTKNGVFREKVDLKNKTCTCKRSKTHRLPCKHVIFVLDKLNRRVTPEQMLLFRQHWVARYFWTENYSEYENKTLLSPSMNYDKVMIPRVREKDVSSRQYVLRPVIRTRRGRPQKKKNQRVFWKTFTREVELG